MKRILAMAGTLLLLAACGENVRTTAPLATLVVPNQAPWLNLDEGPQTIELRGLDDKLTFTPDPPLARALEAQLRAAVQGEYFPNLTIACQGTRGEMSVDTDEAPDQAVLSLSLTCLINASGAISRHEYSAAASARVPAGSDGNVYAHALAGLLKDGAAKIGGQLAADVRASRPTGG
jgi:hypothetical protein